MTEETAGSSDPAPRVTGLLLSLVIPAYNESARLAGGVDRIHEAIASGAIDPQHTEFVLVDDGSTDGTAQTAARLLGGFPHVRVVRLSANHGKGAAVRAGVAVAAGPVIAFADADMAIDPGQTPDFLRALATSDLAIGSRAATGSSVNRSSLRRSAMNRAFNRFVNAVTRVSLDDTQCGFKAFRAPVAKLLFHCSSIDRFAFDVEILSLARHLGFTIDEVPVQWLRVKGSRVRVSVDVASMARDVIRAGRGPGGHRSVPGFTVKGTGVASPGSSSSPATLWPELSSTLPVLWRSEGELMVLCPLMTEDEVADVATRIASAAGDLVLERTDVTITQLRAWAPLSLSWDDTRGVAATP
jgi:hypothetical protein